MWVDSKEEPRGELWGSREALQPSDTRGWTLTVGSRLQACEGEGPKHDRSGKEPGAAPLEVRIWDYVYFRELDLKQFCQNVPGFVSQELKGSDPANKNFI